MSVGDMAVGASRLDSAWLPASWQSPRNGCLAAVSAKGSLAIKQAYCSLAESPSILAGGRRQDSKEGTEQHLQLLSGGGRGGRPGTHVTRAVDCRLHQERAGLEEPLL